MFASIRCALGAGLFAIAAAAAAVPVTGASTGAFSDLSGCDASGLSRECRIVPPLVNAQVQWGSTGRVLDFVNPSTLTAVPVGWDRNTPANDVAIARLDWYNGSTRADRTPDAFSVQWNLLMLFVRPFGSSDPLAFEGFELSVVNSGDAANDRISGFTPGRLAGLELDLGGILLTDLRYAVSGGASRLGDDGVWVNPEGNRSTLVITADFGKVPEPGALALLGLGLVGAAVARRRAA